MKTKTAKPKATDMSEAVAASFKGTIDVNAEVKKAINNASPIQKTKEEVINIYTNLLNGSIDKLRQAIGFLHSCMYRISSVDPKEILIALRDKELQTQHRNDILGFINDAIRSRGRRSSGMVNQEFNPKQHLSLNKVYGPDYNRYNDLKKAEKR